MMIIDYCGGLSSIRQAKRSRIEFLLDEEKGEVETMGEHINIPKFTCSICIDFPESSDEFASVSGCSHRFCFDCIDRWARTEKRCPLCKAKFDTIDRVVHVATPVAASLDMAAENIYIRESLFPLQHQLPLALWQTVSLLL